MFRLATLVTLTVALVATVSAVPTYPFSKRDQCNTGSVQCCNTIQPANAPEIAKLLGGILPIVIQGTNTPIGVTCTPFNIGGAGGGGNCAATPSCCKETRDAHDGTTVGIDCSPIITQL
ncbi:unnamed protein product [Somion occarium]|uniref:Hydrophobin n=1 Tax=Somion occarium TaxID=3059160 RepID=A0ABP1D4I7_9APHY